MKKILLVLLFASTCAFAGSTSVDCLARAQESAESESAQVEDGARDESEGASATSEESEAVESDASEATDEKAKEADNSWTYNFVFSDVTCTLTEFNREHPNAIPENGKLYVPVGQTDNQTGRYYSVAEIGANVYANLPELKRVVIPENVTTIGERAFANCPNLEDVLIPESVKVIASNAFESSPKVTIRTYQGSEAERFANSNGLKLKTIKRPLIASNWDWRVFLVAADEYDAPNSSLQYTKNDALALCNAFDKLGVPKKNITLLTSSGDSNGGAATSENIKEQFEAFVSKLSEGSVAFVYFAGHGFSKLKNGSETKDVNEFKEEYYESFFAPKDYSVKQINIDNEVKEIKEDGQDEEVGKPLSVVDDLLKPLSDSKASFKWLCIDACRSDPNNQSDKNGRAFTKSIGDASIDAMLSPEPPKGCLLMQSCSLGQFAEENQIYGHGLFSYALLDILTGACDDMLDGDQDGAVSLREIRDYLVKFVGENAQETNKLRFLSSQDAELEIRQKPTFSVSEVKDKEDFWKEAILSFNKPIEPTPPGGDAGETPDPTTDNPDEPSGEQIPPGGDTGETLDPTADNPDEPSGEQTPPGGDTGQTPPGGSDKSSTVNLPLFMLIPLALLIPYFAYLLLRRGRAVRVGVNADDLSTSPALEKGAAERDAVAPATEEKLDGEKPDEIVANNGDETNDESEDVIVVVDETEGTDDEEKEALERNLRNEGSLVRGEDESDDPSFSHNSSGDATPFPDDFTPNAFSSHSDVFGLDSGSTEQNGLSDSHDISDSNAFSMDSGTDLAPFAIPVSSVELPSEALPSGWLEKLSQTVVASNQEKRRAGEPLTIWYRDLEIPFVWCPPGRFIMGSPETEMARKPDERQRLVTISRGFWMATTPTLQSVWREVMGPGSNRSYFRDSKLPVERVEWDDCIEFISRLNATGGLAPTGWSFGLPTEAQWEYACRAGTTTPFSFGSSHTGFDANSDSNHPYGNSFAKGPRLRSTTRPGEYPANPWGLYDMHGNVWEWCADWYAPYFGDEMVDPRGPESGVYRVCRGGSWRFHCRHARSASRYCGKPHARKMELGFRMVLVDAGK